MANKTSRRPTISPHSGEGRQIGLDDRELPGGLPHIGNPETHETKTAVPAHRHVPSINEHREPDADPDAPYDTPEVGKVLVPKSPPLPKQEYAVPTYQVQHPGKTPQHLMTLADSIVIPANGADPEPLCSVDYGRLDIELLNEDAANDIRVCHEPDELLSPNGGFLLKHGATSPVKFRTQDRLYAVSVTAACRLSRAITTSVNN